MKPQFEKLVLPDGVSWILLHRLLPCGIPFEWHYHPEFELTLTLNSRGQRFVGDHVGDYDDGDLVLLGPNLPHTWKSREVLDPSKPHEAIVIWLLPGWIASLRRTLPELAPVEALLNRATCGLAFSRVTARAVRPLASGLPALGAIDRLPVLINVLNQLARDPGPEPLASPVPDWDRATAEGKSPDQDRIDRVLDIIHASYRQRISMDDLAEAACLSPSALARLFKRTLGATFTEYITRLRIGRACGFLIDDRYSISYIAQEAGYDNLANFNRQFRALKGITPSAFRKSYRQRLKVA
jgi:AraC-like DNA-binding protein